MRDNLILRGNTYHVRLALPADVRPFFGNRKLLSQSLKTGLQQEAKDRARAILLDWKDQIAQARQIQSLQAEQWREELAKAGTLSQRTLTRTGPTLHARTEGTSVHRRIDGLASSCL